MSDRPCGHKFVLSTCRWCRNAKYALITFTIHCDGSGLPTGGPAGVGYVAHTTSGELWCEKGLSLTDATNQKAEILAAALGLHEIPPYQVVRVVSDSEYVVRGWSEWLPYWVSHDWRKKSGGRAKNVRHWERLLAAADRHLAVRFEWCRGHDGNVHNERADELAGIARKLAEAQ